jgi:Ribosomal protein L3
VVIVGDQLTTTNNLEVLFRDQDKILIFIKGSVPGKNKSIGKVFK